ncbi:Pentatricopeptide repeat [Lasallia pustulata]|uniref:Pentatricopeptide repeat n=1 Tax=Lasallia pustulata TaxID=136370 RepID=A0A1W5DD63_9LECA|nr:Pentatricopeptide repeat [Lasallia pustulata]
MLDYYYETHDRHRVSFEDSASNGLPYLETEDHQSGVEDLTTREQQDDTNDEALAIEKFLRALRDENAPPEDLYELYQALPFPRITYLSEDLRRDLLRRLSIVQRKNQQTMLRYLTVVDDMKAAGLELTSGEWSSSIAFAGRCMARVTAAQVESALHIWKEMELVAKVKGTNVTFNILFDIATKAGKFVLAEMILKEMKARGLAVNRFARVGLIYYYGLKGDGEGVRKAYKELVEVGEIVDTVVLNCVIVSLIRAGELPAANLVYERMKRMHARRTGIRLPSRDWKGSRELGRMLNRAAKSYRSDPEKRQRLQDEQSLAPNLHTFSIFVDHHVTRTGELQSIATLLDEMQFFDVALHGSMFIKLFKGFATHGGIRYSSWTRARLESVWVSFQAALDEGIEDIRVGKWISIWALRAFTKCCGKQRTLQIWEELKSRWKPDASESEVISGVLYKLLHAS